MRNQQELLDKLDKLDPIGSDPEDVERSYRTYVYPRRIAKLAASLVSDFTAGLTMDYLLSGKFGIDRAGARDYGLLLFIEPVKEPKPKLYVGPNWQLVKKGLRWRLSMWWPTPQEATAGIAWLYSRPETVLTDGLYTLPEDSSAKITLRGPEGPRVEHQEEHTVVYIYYNSIDIDSERDTPRSIFHLEAEVAHMWHFLHMEAYIRDDTLPFGNRDRLFFSRTTEEYGPETPYFERLLAGQRRVTNAICKEIGLRAEWVMNQKWNDDPVNSVSDMVRAVYGQTIDPQ